MTDSIIDILKRENEELREQNAYLKRCMGGFDTSFVMFGFTGSEYRVFAALMEREALSKDQILAISYADRLDADLPEPKIVDVFVCKIRKKLRPFDVEIRTIWGRGYSITAEMKAAVRALSGQTSDLARVA